MAVVVMVEVAAAMAAVAAVAAVGVVAACMCHYLSINVSIYVHIFTYKRMCMRVFHNIYYTCAFAHV